MIYIACKEDDCDNKGAPYFLADEDPRRPACPLCGVRFQEIPERKEMTLPDRVARTLRGRNAVLNIFELWVGLAGVVSGVIFFYDPAAIDNNALAQTIGFGLAATWNIMYFISGLLIWYGLLRPSPRMEV